jgi:hypothetical protein
MMIFPENYRLKIKISGEIAILETGYTVHFWLLVEPYTLHPTPYTLKSKSSTLHHKP